MIVLEIELLGKKQGKPAKNCCRLSFVVVGILSNSTKKAEVVFSCQTVFYAYITYLICTDNNFE